MSAKLIETTKKEAGVDRDAFIHRCEEKHVPLVQDLLPPSADYLRNYIINEADSSPTHLKEVQPLDFDLMTEYRFETAADLAEFRQRYAVSESDAEVHLFEHERGEMFDVEEHSTPAELLMSRPKGHLGPPVVKMLAFIKSRPDLSRLQFTEGYEEGHVHTALRLLQVHATPLFAGYVRNYVMPGASYQHGGCDLVTAHEFDVITEIRFWTQDDWLTFLELCAQPEIGELLAEDEARIFDRSSLHVVLSDEYRTGDRPAAAE